MFATPYNAPFSNKAVTSRPTGGGYTPYGGNGQQNAILGGGGGVSSLAPPRPPQTLNAPAPSSGPTPNLGALMTPRPAPDVSIYPQQPGQNPAWEAARQAYFQRPAPGQFPVGQYPGNPAYMEQLQALLARMQGGGFSPYGGMLQALLNRPPFQGYRPM